MAQRPIFPHFPTSVLIKDPKTIAALEQGQYVGAFLRKSTTATSTTRNKNKIHDSSSTIVNSPPEVLQSVHDLHSVGTLCQILKMTSLPDFMNQQQQHQVDHDVNTTTSNNHVSLWILGHRRLDLTGVENVGPPVDLSVHHWEKLLVPPTDSIRALTNEVVSIIREVAQMNTLFRESLAWFTNSVDFDDPYRLSDFCAFALCKSASGDELQAVLEERQAEARLHLVLVLLTKEREVAKLQQEISQKVEETMTEQQRKYMLQQQLKSIKQELGIEQNDKDILLQKYQRLLEINNYNAEKVDPEVAAAIHQEMTKLETLEVNSQEYTVTRSYLDWLCQMPWGKSSPPATITTKQAKVLLDQHHYGMKEVKQAILQYLAVRKLKEQQQQQQQQQEQKEEDGTKERAKGRRRKRSKAKSKVEDTTGAAAADANKENDAKSSTTSTGTTSTSTNETNKSNSTGTILCLAGPPGVGKTSIAASIAQALGREFYRFSVGGLSDVSELKGHRRTYLGSMPGKFIQSLKRVGVKNPVLLIDEIDKLGHAGMRGDPAGAMLELLDPSQNHAFRDLYLDVPVDLSDVVFVCTANDVHQIPGPLRDRMEIITVSGYDLPEKVAIAEQYLVPKALEAAGLVVKKKKKSTTEDENDDNNKNGVEITKDAIESLARWYAREAGVRNLSKFIDKITRQLALSVVVSREEEEEESDDETRTANNRDGDDDDDDDIPIIKSSVVTAENLSDFVGKPIFTSDRLYDKDPLPLGIVMGLAYTSMGGSALYIETQAIVDSKKSNKFTVTGQLGDVMKESTQIALTVARSFLETSSDIAASTVVDPNFIDNHSFHLHVPEGATPKDGPSAGVTMVTSLLSLALQQPCASNVAMTGEVTLSGKVLPVGGIREKTMAARRAGITVLCLPNANQRDWDELPSYLKNGIEVHFCENYHDVYRVAFAAADDATNRFFLNK